MKRIFILGFVILFFSCENDLESVNSIGKGVEFYLSHNAQTSTFGINSYSSIQLDTVQLEAEPFIKYDDILIYDSANHVYTISFSKYNESFLDLFKEPKSFIIKVDSEPIMYGFFWSLIRSQSCPYVHLIEPYEQFDSNNSNELKLHFGYPTAEFAIGDDPRNDPRLISRLKKDGKLRIY